MHKEEIVELEKRRSEITAAEETSKAAINQELDDIQAMIEVDEKMASRLQSEEQEQFTIKEKSRMLVEMIAERKRFFATQRAAEQRSKPPTKAQMRNKMCTYLKNQAGYNHNQLKGRSYDEIQKLFDKAYKQVNSIVPMDSEVVKDSRKKDDSSSKITFGIKSHRVDLWLFRGLSCSRFIFVLFFVSWFCGLQATRPIGSTNTQTSNALHNAIMEAGGKDRQPMLAPGNYVQWKSRIKRYIDTKPNYELIHYCLQNPPYKYKWADKDVPVTEGTDNDIYSTVDACPNACVMWKSIERLKQGESINVQDLKTNLYWEFGKFTSRDGESLESYYSREHIDHDEDDDDDLANERDFLASLIEKLKCEIDDSKNRNKFLETSNKALVDKLKEMKKELFAHQETISIMSQQREAHIKFHKTREDKELDKFISLENKVKVLDNIVYKTSQTVQTMNMLNRNCKTSFAKPEFLKKAQRANPHLYDIGCYNDNLALMLAPESDEVIRFEKES
nr:hypothetical protein [Tanacetum cinerariifolium]